MYGMGDDIAAYDKEAREHKEDMERAVKLLSAIINSDIEIPKRWVVKATEIRQKFNQANEESI